MLPTRDKSVLSKAYLANPSYLRYNPNGYEYDSYKNNDNQHLYFTVDEEIKEGDWFIYFTHKSGWTIKQALIVEHNRIECTDHEVLTLMTVLRKIVATTDTSLNLPSPSPAFIQKYCELDGIDEVLLEYESEEDTYCQMDCNGTQQKELGQSCCRNRLTLKVDPIHNTVTIREIKQLYSPREILDLLELHGEEKLKQILMQ